MGEGLAESVIERHRKRLGARKAKHITIDLDPTDENWTYSRLSTQLASTSWIVCLPASVPVIVHRPTR